jgi:hypothetical protein
MRELLLLLSPLDYTASVAVEAAYVLQQPAKTPEKDQCCGQCKCGIITHGDGHKTPCPCPTTCKCKTCPPRR